MFSAAAIFVLTIGWAGNPWIDTTTAAAPAVLSSVTPASSDPDVPGGALRVQPVGGGGCIIGLNCGCTAICHWRQRQRYLRSLAEAKGNAVSDAPAAGMARPPGGPPAPRP